MRTVSRYGNIRTYVFKAYLTEAGKLSRITAGCRTWRSFEKAHGYFNAGKWTGIMVDNCSAPKTRWAERREARAILDHLERDVVKLRKRMKKQRRTRK